MTELGSSAILKIWKIMRVLEKVSAKMEIKDWFRHLVVRMSVETLPLSVYLYSFSTAASWFKLRADADRERQ